MVQLLLTVLAFGICAFPVAIWSLIEGILRAGADILPIHGELPSPIDKNGATSTVFKADITASRISLPYS